MATLSAVHRRDNQHVQCVHIRTGDGDVVHWHDTPVRVRVDYAELTAHQCVYTLALTSCAHTSCCS
jgi:hypothetical protein